MFEVQHRIDDNQLSLSMYAQCLTDRRPVAINRRGILDRPGTGSPLRSRPSGRRIFDTDGLQLRIDALRQQHAEVAGQTLHLVHAEGRGPSPLPLLLTHGWPGSFLEYLPVLPLLTDPGRTWPIRAMRSRWSSGAGVTAWLGRDQPEAVAAIRLATPGLAVVPGVWTEREEDFARCDQHFRRRTSPVTQAASRARRALLQRHLLGRTPHRRPLSRRRRARATGP